MSCQMPLFFPPIQEGGKKGDYMTSKNREWGTLTITPKQPEITAKPKTTGNG